MKDTQRLADFELRPFTDSESVPSIGPAWYRYTYTGTDTDADRHRCRHRSFRCEPEQAGLASL